MKELWSNKLARVLRHKRMKQKDFAELMGFSRQRASQYMKAIDPPKPETILAMAEKLKVDPNILGLCSEYSEAGANISDTENDGMTDEQRIFEIGRYMDKLPHEFVVYIHQTVLVLVRQEEAKKNIS